MRLILGFRYVCYEEGSESAGDVLTECYEERHVPPRLHLHCKDSCSRPKLFVIPDGPIPPRVLARLPPKLPNNTETKIPKPIIAFQLRPPRRESPLVRLVEMWSNCSEWRVCWLALQPHRRLAFRAHECATATFDSRESGRPSRLDRKPTRP